MDLRQIYFLSQILGEGEEGPVKHLHPQVAGKAWRIRIFKYLWMQSFLHIYSAYVTSKMTIFFLKKEKRKIS